MMVISQGEKGKQGKGKKGKNPSHCRSYRFPRGPFYPLFSFQPAIMERNFSPTSSMGWAAS